MEITPLHNWISGKIGVTANTLNREVLESYQLGKLRQTVELARSRSIFYRRAPAGPASFAVSSLADLQRLPFTTPEDIRQNPLHFLCVSQDQVNRVVTLQSSGTTGEPKRLYFTGEDQELTVDFFHIGMSTLVSPGDTVLILLPGEVPGSVGDLLVKGLQRMGVRGIPYGLVRDPAHTLQVMAEERVNSLVGIPTQVLSLARHRGEGEKQLPLPLKSVLLSTDYVPRAIVRELERAWGCRVYNHYGMTEMGLGGGVECQALAGYHLREADLYFEIIDPATGEPLPEGEEGEIVFTTLTRRGMPILRYRTGDKARFIPDPCPCGTLLKRMDRVKSRVTGSIQVAGGVLTLAELDEALFPLDSLLNFSASITCENGIDVLHINARPAQGAGRVTTEMILTALETIPLLKSAQMQGKMKVAPLIQVQDDNSRVNAAKRVLIDLRKPEGTR
ncbi:MAG: DVU_1553 family AMP-dependent CoA ligase [Bacillota bacterium]|nr:AMP-binding protein [Bacillota bacterium]